MFWHQAEGGAGVSLGVLVSGHELAHASIWELAQVWVQESVQVSALVIHSYVGLAASLGVGSGQLVWYKMECVGFVVGQVKHHVYCMESRSKPVSCLWILLRVQMCTVLPGLIRVCEVASKVLCRLLSNSRPQDC